VRIPRGEQEPGKGAFWALDAESSELYEKGVFKKRKQRPASISTDSKLVDPIASLSELSPAAGTSAAEEQPSPSRKRKTPSSLFASQHHPLQRRSSTSDALATEKADSVLQMARHTFENRSAISFRRHSTPAVFPLPPSPTSFVITSQQQPILGDDETHQRRNRSSSPPKPRVRRSGLSGKPIEEDTDDFGDATARQEEEEEEFSPSPTVSESEPWEDVESEDAFDNHAPTPETLQRLAICSVGELNHVSHDFVQKVHLVSHQAEARRLSTSTTFEIPSHTSPHTYQVQAKPPLVPQERFIPGKHPVSSIPLVSPRLSSMWPLFSNAAMSFSPAVKSFTPSLSLVASFASHNFAPGGGNRYGGGGGFPTAPKSTFSVQDLVDLDWSGNSATTNEDIFFVKECAAVDEQGDFEMVT